jgi:predicted transcriptional regulator
MPKGIDIGQARCLTIGMAKTVDFETLGISQSEIADLLGVSQPHVHRKVHGMREWTRSEINAILEHLNTKHPSTTPYTYERVFGVAA